MKSIDFNYSSTDFAPAERWSLNKVVEQNISIKEARFLEEVFAKIPLMFFILNQKRQIIYLNSLLADELNARKIEHILGFRPGEVLQCENGYKKKGGCGTTKNCKHCGIINSVIESNNINSLITKETDFVSEIAGKKERVVYDVASKPFIWNNEKYTLVTLSNISAKKQKEQLERTFFHDILNKATSISGISELLGMDVYADSDRLITMLKRGILDLSNEIKFQRSIIQAEQGDLVLRFEQINTLEFLRGIAEDFLPHKEALNKSVLISENINPESFECDRVIINRIMTNLVKNAIEAIEKNETVTIGTQRINENTIRLWVKNDVVIPKEIKKGIFKKTVSTKGDGRGIGTYSVKMFAEEFLKGKVSFISEPDKGTTFYIDLPLNHDRQ